MLQLKFLVVLIASAVGYDFFVARKTGEGLCITNEREIYKKVVLPLYNLSSTNLPKNGEFQFWHKAWEMENMSVMESVDTEAYGRESETTVTDGSANWEYVMKVERETYFSFFTLASNASFILTSDTNWKGTEGIRVHLDHVDQDSEEKKIRAEKCTKLGVPEEERCTPLELKANKLTGDLLHDGKRWVWLQFYINNDVLTIKRSRTVLLEWKNSGFKPKYIFGRTYSQRGAFSHGAFQDVGPIKENPNNRMSRTFKVGRYRRLCLRILWSQNRNDWGRYSLKNSTGHEVRSGRLISDAMWNTVLDFHLDAVGVYRLDLLDLTQYIGLIEDCPGSAFEVLSPAIGCSIFKGESHLSPVRPEPDKTFFISRLNRTIEVEFSYQELRDICKTLGVDPRSTENVYFCEKWGCKFVNCP